MIGLVILIKHKGIMVQVSKHVQCKVDGGPYGWTDELLRIRPKENSNRVPSDKSFGREFRGQNHTIYED